MKALNHADMICSDYVLGLDMLGDFDWIAPQLDTMSRKRFWHMSWLVVPRPDGEPLDAPAVVTRASAEVSGLLGGPFDCDLTPFMKPLGGLVFRNPECPLPGLREMPFHDAPGLRYVWLASAFDRWRVQAFGAPDDFFFLSMFTTLDEKDAIDAGGFTRRHPLGDPRELLARIAPSVARRPLRPDNRYSPHIYDAVFTADRLRVRLGVRAVSDGANRSTGEYLYVVRVDTKSERTG